MKKVAIVTVNYNGARDTLELLESLKCLDQKDLELLTVVVDNGSTEGDVEQIEKHFPKVDLLQTGANLGFTGGFNRGMRYGAAAGADYIYIINNDTLVTDPQLLQKLIETIENDEKIGLVASKILFAPGFEFHKDRYTKEETGKVIWYAGATYDWDNLGAMHRGLDEVDRGQYDKVERTNFVNGCCFLIKREVWEKVGFFDESLFAYLEDVDLSRRIHEAGYKQYYDGRTFIYHKISQTAGVGSPKTDYLITRNRLRLGFRYGTNRTKFALLREAFRFLLFGRQYQRLGVIDFLSGITGAPSWVKPENDPVNFPIKLSLVFSNYNTADLCQKLLASVFRPASGFNPKTMEVIMVDDCSPEDPENKIKDYLPKITFVRNKTNQGFVRSYNRLIHLSRGEYVLVMNSDMEVLDNALSEMVKAGESSNGNAVFGGRLYFPDMSSQDSVYHFPTIWGIIKEYFLNVTGSYFMYVPKPEVKTKVEGIVGACMFIPRKVINQIGVLDERMISYFEDHEYCRRLFRNNISTYFLPSAKFIHLHGSSFKLIGTKAFDLHRQASIQYFGKRYYILSYFTLLFAQKLTNKRPAGSMEPSREKTNYIQKFQNLLKNLNLRS